MSQSDPKTDVTLAATAAALECVTGDELKALLVEAGQLVRSETIRIERQSLNPDRRDWAHRQHFRVFRGDSPWLFVTVGHDLATLWERTRQFANECPDIACEPRFLHASGSRQVMGVELIDGSSLEAELARGSVTPGDARTLVESVLRSLVRSRRPSEHELAGREFDTFAARICGLSVFSQADRLMLRELILPFVREQALRGVAETQMSNGDFVARNIIVSPDCRVRLVDCEFAARTHFFAVDTWRWTAFSLVPDVLRTLHAGEASGIEPWVEIYGILQQLSLAWEIHGDDLAREEARARLPRLVEVLQQNLPSLGSSLVFDALMRAPRHDPRLREVHATAQLFWSAAGQFNETESRRVTYPVRRDAQLRFLIPAVRGQLQLRLDPAEATGLVRLRAVRARKLDEPASPTHEPAGSRPPGVEIIRGLLPLDGEDGITLVSLDEDPSLQLPSIDVGAVAVDVVVELLLNFDPSLESLPGLLPK